jgi:unsaturated rhamnogalacturonyl hydrolase
MFVYAFAKGVRKGYLPVSFRKNAERGYAGILKEFITKDAEGYIHLQKTVSVGGLGGVPYRDGSYDYYLSEPLRTDDLKGVCPFILAYLEMEIAKELSIGAVKKVVLDYFRPNKIISKKSFAILAMVLCCHPKRSLKKLVSLKLPD